MFFLRTLWIIISLSVIYGNLFTKTITKLEKNKAKYSLQLEGFN